MSEERAENIGLAEISTLRRADVISADQYVDAAYAARDAESWTGWAQRALLALGVGHLLSGIIFFFAYNWNSLSSFTKFAILEGGIVLTAVAALLIGIRRPLGEMLLLATTVLIGTLLAVFGQVYQTGADAYLLFTFWALLAVPFVLASRSAAHWLVWLIVSYVALTLYEYQVLLERDGLTVGEFHSALAVMTLMVLAAREFAVHTGADWLTAGWTRLVLAIAALLGVFVLATFYVLKSGDGSIPVWTFIAAVLAVGYVYLRRLPDFAVLAITTGFCALFLMAIGWRILEETMGFDWSRTLSLVAALALLTLWCAAMTTGTLKILTHLRRRMGPGRADD